MPLGLTLVKSLFKKRKYDILLSPNGLKEANMSMDKVRLVSAPPADIAEWAWDPILTTPLSVVDENAHSVFVSLEEVLTTLRQGGHGSAVAEWAAYRAFHGNVLQLPRCLVEVAT